MQKLGEDMTGGVPAALSSRGNGFWTIMRWQNFCNRYLKPLGWQSRKCHQSSLRGSYKKAHESIQTPHCKMLIFCDQFVLYDYVSTPRGGRFTFCFPSINACNRLFLPPLKPQKDLSAVSGKTFEIVWGIWILLAHEVSRLVTGLKTSGASFLSYALNDSLHP